MTCPPCLTGNHMACLLSLPETDSAVGYQGGAACDCQECEAMQDAADEQEDDDDPACRCGEPRCEGECEDIPAPDPDEPGGVKRDPWEGESAAEYEAEREEES